MMLLSYTFSFTIANYPTLSAYRIAMSKFLLQHFSINDLHTIIFAVQSHIKNLLLFKHAVYAYIRDFLSKTHKQHTLLLI